MKDSIIWVGLDVHKVSIRVAILRPGAKGVEECEVANRPQDLRRFARRQVREAQGAEVRCCYEAGPCGYSVQRVLEAAAPLVCEVVAPSLIPVRAGDRVKTDRRDARKQARLNRAGQLTVVHTPSEEQEAVRDLTRCREDAVEDLRRARHRLEKMLLRRQLIYHEGRMWTQKHERWLRSLKWERAVERVVFEDYLRAIDAVRERLLDLELAVQKVAEQSPYREPVGWLRCFHGIDTVTAMTIVSELGPVERFEKASHLMSYLGLVPSEWSSGEREQRGGLTKTGNVHLRRVLIEAAWHYLRRPALGPTLRRRRQGQPSWALALADRAQARLHRRFWHLLSKGKPRNKAVAAVARELVGFIWAALRQQALPGEANEERPAA